MKGLTAFEHNGAEATVSFTSVRRRSTWDGDGKRLEFAGQQREVAQQPEDDAAVSDHSVRSEQ